MRITDDMDSMIPYHIAPAIWMLILGTHETRREGEENAGSTNATAVPQDQYNSI